MDKVSDNLNKNGSFYKFNGIVECVKNHLTTEEIVSKLKALKTDDSQITGHSISDFSIAALDIMGIEKYNCDDMSIMALINSNFDF